VPPSVDAKPSPLGFERGFALLLVFLVIAAGARISLVDEFPDDDDLKLGLIQIDNLPQKYFINKKWLAAAIL